jgi:4-amino-4-deoxy-L-arabinose transferase-like glycosyltransferase
MSTQVQSANSLDSDRRGSIAFAFPADASPASAPTRAACLWILAGLWTAIFFSSLFAPPLFDDADATHANAARHILLSGDWVTLKVNGIRYLEKAPLPYWLDAISFRLFGFNALAAHLPQAIAVLLLTLLGFVWAEQAYSRRAALYTGVFVLTSAGVFLFTRVFIPEVWLSLFLCAALYTFLQSLTTSKNSVILSEAPELIEGAQSKDPEGVHSPIPLEPLRNHAGPPHLDSEMWAESAQPSPSHSAAYPYLTWTALALAVLTKGLVALVFFCGTAIVYLALTGEYRRWRALKPFTGGLLFLAIAAPWHILAGLRNTNGALNGHTHGFFWFYFVNEHFLRFLGKRYPVDYNKLPGYLFWSLHLVWLFPWALFAPLGVTALWRKYRQQISTINRNSNLLPPLPILLAFMVVVAALAAAGAKGGLTTLLASLLYAAFLLISHRVHFKLPVSPFLSLNSSQKNTLLLTLFSALVLGFFSLSTNQEYYTFPAYLPLLMLVAVALTRAESDYATEKSSRRWVLFAHAALSIVGIAIAITLFLGLWSSRHLPFVPDIGSVLAHRGVGDYTLSMSHMFDLTGPSFAALRLPAVLAALAFAFGPAIAWILRAQRRHLAATSAIALTASTFLIAAHIALIRFGPMMSSENLAAKIMQLRAESAIASDTQILLYGDQSYGSSIAFYLGEQVSLVEGRSSSMLFGSTFPDAPHIFLTNADLLSGWGTGPRKLLFVPLEKRDDVDKVLGTRQIVLAETSGKALITDRPLASR